MAKPTKANVIREALAGDIVHGRLLPGEALDEASLAARFGVSRTPLREAFRQLEAIGLAKARPHQGLVVTTKSEQELDEMFAVTRELEGLCARWSAIAMTPAERRNLLALQEESERLVSAGDLDAYVAFNDRFHEAIYQGSHNAFLEELTLGVRQRCAPYRHAQFETLGRLVKSHREHDAVVNAIQRGDADEAAREMRAHITVVRTAVDEVATEAAPAGEGPRAALRG